MADTANENVIPIEYVGTKDEKRDTINHTGTVWKKGQTVPYPAKLASGLLVHTDVWKIGRRTDYNKGSGVLEEIATAQNNTIPDKRGMELTNGATTREPGTAAVSELARETRQSEKRGPTGNRATLE